DDRYMAGYDAFSLFLALGVPFEVCDTLPDDGWVFLGNASAGAIESGSLEPTGAKLLARVGSGSGRFAEIPESFEDLFALRRTLLDGFREKQIPYVEEETPVVLSEYPESRTIYIWNIEPEEKTIHVRKGEATIALSLLQLDSAMVAVQPDGTLTEVKFQS
ncbi:MAG: hypothetical protein J6S27_07185, partial [Thermoguttaceae bacterium]|nr:hypothetical protein [Thermoguttaceae bacterium]